MVGRGSLSWFRSQCARDDRASRIAGQRRIGIGGGLRTLVLTLVVIFGFVTGARATDFYELQIYSVDTVPQDHVMVELHTNSVTSATGELASSTLPLYQIHNTIEVTYGLLPYLEVGQYICTARLDAGTYEYAGGRTKVHFGIPETESWPISFGANIEFQYMRREAVSDPLNIEFMPIAQMELGRLTAIANLSFEKQFSGPGTHQGIGLEPMGQISYRILHWFEPSLEYYGDIGPVQAPVPLYQQQQFIVPSVNLYLDPRFEFNFGVGFGTTRAWQGRFVKATIGWLL